MHHELVCHQKHWPKLSYTNTREVHLKVVLGRNVFGQPYAMCLAVMYFNKLQSVYVRESWVHGG